jgi:hypothetical protein
VAERFLDCRLKRQLSPLSQALFEMCVRVREKSRRVLVPIALPRSEGPPRLFRLDCAPKAASLVHVPVLGGDAREVSECVHGELPVTDSSAETEGLAGTGSRLLGPSPCQG